MHSRGQHSLGGVASLRRKYLRVAKSRSGDRRIRHPASAAWPFWYRKVNLQFASKARGIGQTLIYTVMPSFHMTWKIDESVRSARPRVSKRFTKVIEGKQFRPA